MKTFIEYNITSDHKPEDFPYIVSCKYSVNHLGLINIRVNTSSEIFSMTDDIEFVDGQKYVVIYVGKWYDNECFDYSKIFIQSDDNIVVAYQALFESSYIVTLIPKTLTKLKLDCKSIQ